MQRKVAVEQIIEVTVDESKFTPEFMVEFQKTMYDFDTIEEHIEHLGQLAARGIYDEFTTFIEGYGPPKDMGISFKITDQVEEIVRI
jgi:hypothetical protein